ncbi:MAG: hypothetical protein AAF460_03685 [Pseudomonadota bacterium]
MSDITQPRPPTSASADSTPRAGASQTPLKRALPVLVFTPPYVTTTLARLMLRLRTLLGALATLAILGALNPALAQDSQPFHIKHWTSGKYIHPDGGSAHHDTYAVLHSGKGAHTQFIFRPVEQTASGHWGLLIHRQSGLALIPYGGRIDTGNGGRLVFHSDHSPGAHFFFDEAGKLIQHRGNKFWHPEGGDSRPGNNTPVVIYDGNNNNTKFFAVDPTSDQQIAVYQPKAPVVAGTARGVWVVGCSGGQNCETALETSMDIGTVTEDSWAKEVQNAVSVSIEAGVEFGAASASTNVTTSHTNTRSSAGSIARSSSRGFKESCKSNNDFTKFDVAVVYQWQVEVPVEDTSVTIKTCQIACQSATGQPPSHGPLHPTSLNSCKVPLPTAAAEPKPEQPQNEWDQLAQMLGVSTDELFAYIGELQELGYEEDAIQLFLANDIAIATGQPSLSEYELDEALRGMGYTFE